MLAQQRRILPWVQVADAFMGVAAVVVAVTFAGRNHFSVRALIDAFRPGSTILNLPVAALFGWIWHLCLKRRGLYDNAVRKLSGALNGCVMASIEVSFAFALLYLISNGRHFLLRATLLFALLALLIELTRTILVARIARLIFDQKETILVLGTGRRAQRAWRHLRIGNHAQAGFVGFVNDCDPDSLPPDIRQRVVCRIADLPAYLHTNHVDVLIVATSSHANVSQTREAIAVAEAFDLRVLCLEDALELGRSGVPNSGGNVFNEVVNHHRKASSLLAVKNVSDRLLALVLFIISAPIQLGCCAAIFASGVKPVFVTRRRYGYHRHPFNMLSLNTGFMHESSNVTSPAIGSSAEHDGCLEAAWAAPLGALLRWLYLDRLPRLLNVIKGDMALIGPEPLNTLGASPIDNPEWELAFTAKPGLFRPSHLMDRSRRSEANAVKVDSIYLSSWSLMKDLSLLSRIFFVRIVGLVLTIRRSVQGSASLEGNQPLFGTVSGDGNE